MTRSVVLSDLAKLKLQTLDPQEAARILDAVARIAQDPRAYSLKHLAQRKNTYLYQVGRIVLVMEVEERQLTLVTAYQHDEVRDYVS